jgi:hypothetical protein
MKVCTYLVIKQIFTNLLNLKGNTNIERVIKNLKNDLNCFYDWNNPFTFQRVLDEWGDNYNHNYLHPVSSKPTT